MKTSINLNLKKIGLWFNFGFYSGEDFVLFKIKLIEFFNNKPFAIFEIKIARFYIGLGLL